MASPSLAAAATSPASSPLTLDAIPLASRPAATTAAPRKRSVLLLDHRPHPASPAPPHLSSSTAAAAAAAAASAPHLRRKKASHPPRPRWVTVLRVAIKNALLLAALLYLGDLAWRWSHPPAPSSPPRDLEAYAARFDEVEASLARTFRMIQVQLEAIDRKIDGEVGAARDELLAMLKEQRLALEDQLARLDARAGELGHALDGIKRMEFVRKAEFEKFVDEVKASLGSGSGSSESEVDLDKIRAMAREVVMREIEKHAADGIGRVDYAVASGGGRVVRHSEPYVQKRGGFMGWRAGHDLGPKPEKMLQPSFGEPGHCFAMQGSSGFVEIKLKSAIIPEAVTLEHVSKDVAYDRSTAPKDCQVSGWYEEMPGETQLGHAAKVALAEFTYDLEKNNVQTFDVSAPNVGVINMVRLDFTSNHGNSQLTCIYRLRVHGHEPVSPGAAGSQA